MSYDFRYIIDECPISLCSLNYLRPHFGNQIELLLPHARGLLVLGSEVVAHSRGAVEDLSVADLGNFTLASYLLAPRAVDDRRLLVLADLHVRDVVSQLILRALQVVVVLHQVHAAVVVLGDRLVLLLRDLLEVAVEVLLQVLQELLEALEHFDVARGSSRALPAVLGEHLGENARDLAHHACGAELDCVLDHAHGDLGHLGEGGTAALEAVEDLQAFLDRAQSVDVVLLLSVVVLSSSGPDLVEDLDVGVGGLE